MNRSFFALYFAILASSAACAQWVPLNPVRSTEKTADGVIFRMQTGLLKVQVSSDSIIRVIAAGNACAPVYSTCDLGRQR